MLTLDRRETALSDALSHAEVVHSVKQLPVGDVLCEYEAGLSWIAERKTFRDLGVSITKERLSEQTVRLHDAGYEHIFWLIEGHLEDSSLSCESLWGACLNMTFRNKSHFIRTTSIQETAFVIKQLAKKCQAWCADIPRGVQSPRPVTKRKRDNDKDIVFVRQLMCVPSVGESGARKLQERFRTLPQLQEALKDISNFPRVQMSAKCCIGESRLQKLKEHLCE